MQAPLTFAVDNRLPEILERVRQLFPRQRRERALSPVDQLIYGVVAHQLSASAATASYRRLRQVFPKLVDLRQAAPYEIEAELIGVPAATLKAAAVPEILKRIEEAFGHLALDGLARMDSEGALRFLLGLPFITEDIAASVIAFTGAERTVLTVGKDAARPLRRLALAEPGAPLSALPRQLIERSPTAWRQDDFAALSQGLLRVADRFCHPGKPDCGACPLASLCPAAEKRSANVVAFPFGQTATMRAAQH